MPRRNNIFSLNWQSLSNSIRSFYTLSIMVGSYGVLYLNSFGVLNEFKWSFNTRMIFISSIMIFFAAKIILIFCPHEIRHTRNAAQFLRENKESYESATFVDNILSTKAVNKIGTSSTKHSKQNHFAMHHFMYLIHIFPVMRFLATILLATGVVILMFMDLISVIEIISKENQSISG